MKACHEPDKTDCPVCFSDCGQCNGANIGSALSQAMSEGPLRQDEFPTQWWNRYIIDGNRLCVGYDLTCWALPLKVSIGRYDINISILCFDIGYYFGEIYW